MKRTWRADLDLILAGEQRRYALALLWTGAVAVLMTALNPLATRWIFDGAVAHRQLGLLIGVASVSLVVFSALRWLDFLAAQYQQWLSNRLSRALTRRMVEAYFELPPHQVAAHSDGYYVARTMTEVDNVVGPVVGTGVTVLRAVMILITATITVLLLSWKLTLILVLITPALILLARRFSLQLHHEAGTLQERSAQQQQSQTSAISAYRAVRIFGLRAVTLDQLLLTVTARLDAAYALSYRSGTYSTLSRISLGLAELLVLVAGGYAVMTTSLTLGSLLAYMGAYWMAVSAVQSLIDLLPRIGVLRATVWRLQDLIAEARRAERPPGGLTGEIQWLDVTCSYTGVPVLEQVTLTVASGTRVMVRGANGAGKSTLALTALGLLEPSLGQVRRPERVSGLIEPVFFPPLPLAALIADRDPHLVSVLAGALELSGLLHHQYSELSLGQRKKFSLMMTLLTPADLYVFDEPLANLDDPSRDVALDLMFTHTAGKTLLAVMHDAARTEHLFDLCLTVASGQVEARQLKPGGPPANVQRAETAARHEVVGRRW